MIPTSIINKLHEKEKVVNYGSITLEIVKYNGHISRYIWTDKTSEVECSTASSEVLPKKQGRITEHTDVIDEVKK
jgi:hypothetical protein